MKSYIIKKINYENIDNNIWNNITPIEIDCFPWNENNYTPKTEVKLLYTNDCFKIKFTSYEKSISVKAINMNEAVYKDSCVEFFFNLDPKNSNNYMNFEMNVIGTLLLQIGSERQNRVFITDVDCNIFDIKSTVTEKNFDKYNNNSWSVEYSIPFSFLYKYYDNINLTSGYEFKGNFYKCGDCTQYPHYGCWNPITIAKPNFHVPDFFGQLILE